MIYLSSLVKMKSFDSEAWQTFLLALTEGHATGVPTKSRIVAQKMLPKCDFHSAYHSIMYLGRGCQKFGIKVY